jgi:predicted transcriptional regulator
MAKRITIMLDDDLVRKLHEIQAKLIKQSKKSVSFSHVLNEVARKGLKYF